MYCYLNGKIIPENDALASVRDLAFLRGYGVYDGMTAFGNKLFYFEGHYNRLKSSADFLGITLPILKEEMRSVMEGLIAKHGFKRSNFRTILTAGPSENGIDPSGSPTFFILIEKHVPIDEGLYQNGTVLITTKHQRTYPKYKTINYITAVLLQKKRKDANAIEILYHSDGKILECSTSNFFLVLEGKLITPKDGILFGITRKVVIEIANKEGIEVEERVILFDELQKCSEAFITSSFKDVVPVVRVDDQVVGNGKVGPITKQLMVKFQELTKN